MINLMLMKHNMDVPYLGELRLDEFRTLTGPIVCHNTQYTINFNSISVCVYDEHDLNKIVHAFCKYDNGIIETLVDTRSLWTKIKEKFKPVTDELVLCDSLGREVFVFKSDLSWTKKLYLVSDGILTVRFLDSDGFYCKRVYNKKGDVVYYENSTGHVEVLGKRKFSE